MEGKEKVDRIEIAIQQQQQQLLMDEQKEMTPHDHSLHLSNSISQGDGRLQQHEPSDNANDGINEDDEKLAIRKELREIKRQNFITQCLVSALIVLTVTWQLSEVSLILKVKDRISHPFRSFATTLKGVLMGPNLNTGQNGDKLKNSSDERESEGSLVPPIKIPEMPHLGLDNDEK